MNNNEIKNTKVVVPVGKKLNDKDYMNSLLSNLKELSKNYVVVLTEVSNNYLFQEYKNMFEEFLILQRKVYELMFQKGWYILEKADKIKISNKFEIFNQELSEINM